MSNLSSLMIDLHRINAIKFGRFKLKSGMISPVYIDLRVLVSFPTVLIKVAKAYVLILKKLKYERMAAVPYAALPIVANISALNKKPWIYTRKEAKKYGIKKPVEGEFSKGEKVVLVDDMITTGASKMEVIKPLESLGLAVSDIVVLVDREQGGREQLKKAGYHFYAAFTISQWLKTLRQAGKISQAKYTEVINYLNENKIR